MRKVALISIISLFILALIGIANAEGPVKKGGSKDKAWSALDNVPRFKDTLDKAGFNLEEGDFEFWDLIKDTCQGKVPDALANNPWPNAYITMKFKPVLPENSFCEKTVK